MQYEILLTTYLSWSGFIMKNKGADATINNKVTNIEIVLNFFLDSLSDMNMKSITNAIVPKIIQMLRTDFIVNNVSHKGRFINSLPIRIPVDL
jgi:hypothetical protein